jgi:hypothetical protein
MAANEYFKLAASYLRRGIEATKQELNNRRNDIERMKLDANKEVTNIKDQIRMLESDISRPKNESNLNLDRSTELRMVMDKQQAISDKQRTVADYQTKLTEEIKSQERMLMGLEQQARQLEGM